MGDRFASPTHLAVKRGLARHPFSDTQEDIEARFRLMEDAGVGRQVLSPNHPPYLPDETECVTAVKMLNDAYAEFARRYPDRISSYVMLPLPHVDASLKEMERGFDELGCVGVNMNIVCLGRSIAETEFEPLYAEMNRRGAVLFVHPARQRHLLTLHHRLQLWRIGRHLDRGRDFVLHMIAKQIPYRYPRIKFIVPHLGGPIPTLMNRLDKQGQGPRGHPNLAEAPSVTARRFYYDTVCYGSKPAFLCALEAFGADHIVTGSDYPVLQDWEVYRETFAYIERLGLPKEVTDEILHHNAQKLFGFDH